MSNNVTLIKAEIKYHMAMMKVGMKLSKYKLTKQIGDDLFDKHAQENLTALIEFIDAVKARKKIKDELINRLESLENDLHQD